MLKKFFAKLSDEEGQGLVEYALIIVLVSIVCMVALRLLGVNIGAIFTRITNILFQQDEVIKLEPLRQQKIRDGITKLLEDNVGKENYDSNRLEQELIYYIEKIDISEEQVRLKNHCDYFRTLLSEPEESKGKKLSFVLQEIGREINTTGSKAYDSTIQKCVVMMKDELEKAKEQVLNVL